MSKKKKEIEKRREKKRKWYTHLYIPLVDGHQKAGWTGPGWSTGCSWVVMKSPSSGLVVIRDEIHVLPANNAVASQQHAFRKRPQGIPEISGQVFIFVFCYLPSFFLLFPIHFSLASECISPWVTLRGIVWLFGKDSWWMRSGRCWPSSDKCIIPSKNICILESKSLVVIIHSPSWTSLYTDTKIFPVLFFLPLFIHPVSTLCLPSIRDSPIVIMTSLTGEGEGQHYTHVVHNMFRIKPMVNHLPPWNMEKWRIDYRVGLWWRNFTRLALM